MLNIVGHRKIWFALSTILLGVAIVSIATFGFKESVEFKGGTLWEFKATAENPSVSDVQSAFVNILHVNDAQVGVNSTNQSFLVRFGTLDEPTHQTDINLLKTKWPSFTELNFQSISPAIGAGLKQNAIIAIILVLLGI